jgi:hypothetical protein
MAETPLLEYRVSKVEEAVLQIAENLQALTRLELHHKETREAMARAFGEITKNRKDFEEACEKVDLRLRGVELQLPILKMTSRWIIGGTIGVVSGVFSMLGVILWALLPYILKGTGG